MSMKRRPLNRSLSAILGQEEESSPAPEALESLPVEYLAPGRYQPRRDIPREQLLELAQSIRTQGILQPILVRRLAEPNRYEIIAGERRWRAAQIAGQLEVPVIVRTLDDAAALQVALIENLQRTDLLPLEEALALKQLVTEFHMTHEQVAETVGRSRAGVTNLLRLLDLRPVARELLQSGRLEMGHARALLSVTGSAQDEAARFIVEHALNVRQTERYLKRIRGPREATGAGPGAAGKKPRDADRLRLERELSEHLGRRVEVETSGVQGKNGRMLIHFRGLDDFESLLARLGYRRGT
jgi:ParB family chromosome partitioning protein